jgi:hypothetical protein
MKDLAIAVSLFVVLLAALELGFRAGQRATSESDARSTGQIGAIQGAILGLLGLLLAFSFAGAATRFLERQDLIVQEANAIGTAYLRADLLDEPQRSELHSALKRYTEFRIELSDRLRSGLQPSDAAEVQRLQSLMWRAAREGVLAKPAFVNSVLPPINEVIDLHSTRLAAARKHVPALVLGLLIACSLLSVDSIGYGTGLGGRRRPLLTLSLVAIIGTSLWIIIDLDRPRAGLMRISEEPLRAITFDRQ